MPQITIKDRQIESILSGLLGRDVGVTPLEDGVQPHSSTARGLVTDENQLVAVIATDLRFAHRSAAAMAMMPANIVDEDAEDADADLMEVYQEVANVLSRLANEASPTRVRIDPNMDHSMQALQQIVVEGQIMSAVETEIEGYGPGRMGIWHLFN
ncbi:MAG: hypothetical protein AAF547_04700 [Actinomycetota bacterium]